MPDFSLEESLGLSTSAVIVGVDEVGRGPLAGPVTAAAVFVDRQKITSNFENKPKSLRINRNHRKSF